MNQNWMLYSVVVDSNEPLKNHFDLKWNDVIKKRYRGCRQELDGGKVELQDEEAELNWSRGILNSAAGSNAASDRHWPLSVANAFFSLS